MLILHTLRRVLIAASFAAFAMPAASDQFHIGVGMGNTSAEYKNSDGNAYFLPVVQYQSDLWSINIDRAELYLPLSQKSWLSAIAALRLQTLNDDTSDATRGMEARKESLDAGMGFNFYDQQLGYFALEWVHDISQVHQGQKWSLVAAWPLEGPRLAIIPAVYFHQLDQQLVDYYYGVRAQEQQLNRPAYRGQATTNIGSSLEVSYNMTPRWRMQAEARITHLGKGITASPIVDTDYRWNTMLSVSYKL
ncbi:MAG: hypothetical protein COB09_05500 [Thalassobium sp.]|nr:MAG: hypothetical protein COB09_05500 [Thalassobium sp.]